MRLSALLKRTYKKAEFVVESAKSTTHSPWWNSDCARDFRRRQAAWKKLMYNQCPQNWSHYKFYAGNFKRTVSLAKEDYDRKHYDYLSKPKNKKALFRFMRSRKILPPPTNIDCEIMSAEEMKKSLEIIAKGLECRFTSTKSYNWQIPALMTDFTKVTLEELAQVIQDLPSSAPGPDGITVNMIKIFLLCTM